MRTIALAVAAGVALSSCTTTGGSAKIDATIQKSLPQICNAAEQSYATFLGVAATGALKPATINKVETAYAVAKPICDNPASATAAGTASKVIILAFTLKQALTEAGK